MLALNTITGFHYVPKDETAVAMFRTRGKALRACERDGYLKNCAQRYGASYWGLKRSDGRWSDWRDLCRSFAAMNPRADDKTDGPVPPPTPEQLARATVRAYLAQFEHAAANSSEAAALLADAREHGASDLLNDVTELVVSHAQHLDYTFEELIARPWCAISEVAAVQRSCAKVDSITSGDYALDEY